MHTVKILQVEGLTAQQILDRFNDLSNQIETLKAGSTAPNVSAEYLTRSDVTDLLRVSAVTLHDWTNKGFLKSYRLGKKVFYKRSEIDAAMVEIKKGGRKHEN